MSWTLVPLQQNSQYVDRSSWNADASHVFGRNGPSRLDITRQTANVNLNQYDPDGLEQSHDSSLDGQTLKDQPATSSDQVARPKRKRRKFNEEEKQRQKEVRLDGGCAECRPKHKRCSHTHEERLSLAPQISPLTTPPEVPSNSTLPLRSAAHATGARFIAGSVQCAPSSSLHQETALPEYSAAPLNCDLDTHIETELPPSSIPRPQLSEVKPIGFETVDQNGSSTDPSTSTSSSAAQPSRADGFRRTAGTTATKAQCNFTVNRVGHKYTNAQSLSITYSPVDGQVLARRPILTPDQLSEILTLPSSSSVSQAATGSADSRHHPPSIGMDQFSDFGQIDSSSFTHDRFQDFSLYDSSQGSVGLGLTNTPRSDDLTWIDK